MFKKKNPTHIRTRQPNPTVPERRRVFSYHANRTPVERRTVIRRADSFATPKPKSIAWWKQIPMIIAVLVIVGCIVDSLLLSTSPRVVLLGTTSNQFFLRPEATYAHAAQQLLAGSILNRNKLTINSTGISRALTQQFPELANASITLPLLGNRPVVYVEPEEPALILAAQAGGAFIISQSGKALIAITEVANPDSLKLPVITDQSGLAIQIGKPTLSTISVSFMQTVAKQFQAQLVPIASFTLPPAGSEFDVRLSGQPYIIKFNLQEDVTQQVGTFIATKNYLVSHTITPRQYVDVRVAGRAYYK